MRWVGIALAVALAACQLRDLDVRHDAPVCEDGCIGASSRVQREVAMNRKWQNRTFTDLKAALGPPRLIMAIPGGGNPPGFVAVYSADPETGCIDAFAFFHGGDPVIRVYHCR